MVAKCFTGEFDGDLRTSCGICARNFRKAQRGYDHGQANSPPVVRSLVSQLYLVPVSLWMRSSTGGWVLKRFMRLFPDKGFMINM